MMKPIVPVLLAMLACLPSPLAAQPKQELVKAELLADTSAVEPGAAFTVGVRLRIEPGWHVYWMNPGESGVPTTVKLKAPAGFKVEPAQYPVPIKFDQPGEVLGYGYERELLLTARLTPPANLEAGAEVELTADVGWLACRNACVPGKAKLSLKLRVSDEPQPANRALFDEWSARMPVASDPSVAQAEWNDSRAGKGLLTHVVRWKSEAPANVELYPGQRDVIDVKKVGVKRVGVETRMTLEARRVPGSPLEGDTLPSLLVYTDDAGKRHGIPIEIPVAELPE